MKVEKSQEKMFIKKTKLLTMFLKCTIMFYIQNKRKEKRNEEMVQNH